MTIEHMIEPYQEFPVPGTLLTVYHQSDEEGYAHVEDDGRVKLSSGPDWWVRIPEAVPAAVETAIREFSWDNYGLDDVQYTLDDPDTQDWVRDLAKAVLAGLKG